LGFHPVAAVGKLEPKEERDSYTQKEKKYTHTHTKYKNTQSRKQT